MDSNFWKKSGRNSSQFVTADGDFIDGNLAGDVTSVGCNFLTELLDLMEFFATLITGAIRWSKLFQRAAQTQETGKEE